MASEHDQAPSIHPELAARITAARALLGDFARFERGHTWGDWAAWARRLGYVLADVLDGIEGKEAPADPV